MKINDQAASHRTRTPVARGLAYVLLIGIIYAVTFGSAHSHGNVSSKLDTNSVASVKGKASSLSNVPLHSHPDTQQCLICLLHQQLFNSIVQPLVFIVKPSAPAPFISTLSVLYHSSPTSSGPIPRLSGRAPPFDRG
jgi:hypothetical protein